MNGIIDKISDTLSGLFNSLLGNVSNVADFDFGYTMLILVFLFIVIVLLGFTLGKSKMMLALLSVYVAGLLNVVFPYHDEILQLLKTEDGTLKAFIARLAVMLVFLAIAILILKNSVVSARFSHKEVSTPAILVMSVLMVGLIASIVVPFVPVNAQSVSGSTVQYFGSSLARFLWAVIPLIGVAIISARD